MLIVLAVIAMLIGPLLYLQLQRIPGWARRLERGLVWLLLVLVVLALLPEVYTEAGFIGILLVVVGIVLPSLLEHSLQRVAHTTHIITLIIATLGLALHSALDGAALTDSISHSSAAFISAVVLHRLMAGMVIWFILQPVFGSRTALIVISVVALAAAPGYWFAGSLADVLSGQGAAMVQAVVVGTIIHGLLHRGHQHQH